MNIVYLGHVIACQGLEQFLRRHGAPCYLCATFCPHAACAAAVVFLCHQAFTRLKHCIAQVQRSTASQFIGRVRRDPGTRPVPNFFSSSRPVLTRKLKMTGYRVIKFHLESNKIQSWMRNPAIKVTNPINPGTGNHFFVIWGKWSRTGAVISSKCLRPIDMTWLARWERMQNCSLCASQ